MSPKFQQVEQEARELDASEKAQLVHVLIEDLDPVTDTDAADKWAEESERRYNAYLEGKIESVSGNEAMQRARRHLK